MLYLPSCQQQLLFKLPLQWNPTLCLLLQRSLPPQQLATTAAAFYQMRAKQSTASWDMLLTSFSRRQPRIGVQGELKLEPLLWSFPGTFVVGFLHFLLRVSDDISADSLDRFLRGTLAAHDSIPPELKSLQEQLSEVLCHRNRCNNDVENERLCVVTLPAEAVLFCNSDHTVLTNEKSLQSKYSSDFTKGDLELDIAPGWRERETLQRKYCSDFTKGDLELDIASGWRERETLQRKYCSDFTKGDLELDIAPGWRERETRKRICSSDKHKQKCLSSKDIDIIFIDVNNVEEESKGRQRTEKKTKKEHVVVNDKSAPKLAGSSCYRDGSTQEEVTGVGSSCQAWDGSTQEEVTGVGSSCQTNLAWDVSTQEEVAGVGSSCQAWDVPKQEEAVGVGSSSHAWDVPKQEEAVGVGSSCHAWDVPKQEEAVGVGSSCHAWDVPKQEEAVGVGSSCQASLEALGTTADSVKWHAMALPEIVQHFTSPSIGSLTSDDRAAAIDILIRRTLETQEDCASRHLLACLSDLALTFPLQLASALSACLQRGPCSTSMAEIVASICKVWDPKTATYFIRSLCTPDLQLCEDLLPVVQCALTVGPDLSLDLLSALLRLLESGATSMAANAKYGRLVLTVVKACSSQMTTSHTATLRTIASMHTSVLSKLLKTSIDRLPL